MARNKKKQSNKTNANDTHKTPATPKASASVSTPKDDNNSATPQPSTSSRLVVVDPIKTTNSSDTPTNITLCVEKTNEQLNKVKGSIDILKIDQPKLKQLESSTTGASNSNNESEKELVEKLKNVNNVKEKPETIQLDIHSIASLVSVVEQQQGVEEPKSKKRNRNNKKKNNITKTDENNDNVNNMNEPNNKTPIENVITVNDHPLNAAIDKNEQNNPTKKRKNKKSKNTLNDCQPNDNVLPDVDAQSPSVISNASKIDKEMTNTKKESINTVKESTVLVNVEENQIEEKNSQKDTKADETADKVNISCDTTKPNKKKHKKNQKKQLESDHTKIEEKLSDSLANNSNNNRPTAETQKQKRTDNKNNNQLETVDAVTPSESNQNLQQSPLTKSIVKPNKNENVEKIDHENKKKEIIQKIILEEKSVELPNLDTPNTIDRIPPSDDNNSVVDALKQQPLTKNQKDNTTNLNKGGGKKHKVEKSTEKSNISKDLPEPSVVATTLKTDSKDFTEETVESPNEKNSIVQMTEIINLVKEVIDASGQDNIEPIVFEAVGDKQQQQQQQQPKELVKKEDKTAENTIIKTIDKNPPSSSPLSKKDKNKKKDFKNKSSNDNKTPKDVKLSDDDDARKNVSVNNTIAKNEVLDDNNKQQIPTDDKQKSNETAVLDEKLIIDPIVTSETNKIVDTIIENILQQIELTSNETIKQNENTEQPAESVHDSNTKESESFVPSISSEGKINEQITLPIIAAMDENKNNFINTQSSNKHSIADTKDDLKKPNNEIIGKFSIPEFCKKDITILTPVNNECLTKELDEIINQDMQTQMQQPTTTIAMPQEDIKTEMKSPCDDDEIFEIINQTTKKIHEIDNTKPPTKLTELITKNIPSATASTTATSSKSNKKSSKSPEPTHANKKKNDNRSMVVESNKKSSNKELICPQPQQQRVNKSKKEQLKMKTNHDPPNIDQVSEEMSSASLTAMPSDKNESPNIENEKVTIINTEESNTTTIDPTTKQQQQQLEQQSLLSTISKNAEGSDFVQSVNLTSSSSPSLSAEQKTTNKFETKSLVKKSQSPSSSLKLVKDLKNLQQSINENQGAATSAAPPIIDEDNEMKHHELPEKTPQQKLDSIKFSDIKLINNLEAKMTISNNNNSITIGATANTTNQQSQSTTKKTINDQLENVTASPTPPTRPTRLSKKPQIPPKPEHLLKNLSKKITPLLMQQLNNYDNNNNNIISSSSSTTNLDPPASGDDGEPSTQSASSILVQSLLTSAPPLDDEDIKMPLLIKSKNPVDGIIKDNHETINVDDNADDEIDEDSYEDVAEEYIEYKFTPRQMFMSTICQICKISLNAEQYTHYQCGQCKMVSYCSQEHCANDAIAHKQLCGIIQEIARKRGGHIYNNARILNDDDYRSLRVHTLSICENLLGRPLQPFEREILLFPRLCIKTTCREWRQHLLEDCSACGQVSYCRDHPEHLQMEIHETWCKSFGLYHELVKEQLKKGRIEPELPTKIVQLNQYNILHKNFDNIFKDLYKNYSATIRDNCTWATLTQLATAPLTAFYGSQIARQCIGERMVIHLIGAELQFEADTLDKWETFFLHLIPQLMELQIVFIGPELNVEHLPLEILSRIRMCRHCRQSCRCVKFDFQWGKLYHDYCKTPAFIKPDLICYFNPGLYRKTGYNGLDTWPETIKSSLNYDCPIIVTSYTEMEAPCDLQRIQQESLEDIKIIKLPHKNPFSAQRPERNFISDEIAPMIFKNYYYFIIK